MCTTIVDVQLLSQGPKNEGVVSVLRDGQWGVVCDDHWDDVDASVVCRILGYTGVSMATRNQHTTENFLMDDVDCSGSEDRIHDCGHRGWGSHDCDEYEGAGVICDVIGGKHPEYTEKYKYVKMNKTIKW